MGKRCTKCGEVKELSLFNRDSSKKDGRYSSCSACNNVSRIGYRSCNANENNKKYKRTTRADYYRKDPRKYLFEIAKVRAKKFNIPFDIEPEDITLVEYCPITGEKLDILNNNTRNGMSLDRINNSQGYVKGNVAIISRKANRMKADMTMNHLRKIIEYMEKNNGR